MCFLHYKDEPYSLILFVHLSDHLDKFVYIILVWIEDSSERDINHLLEPFNKADIFFLQLLSVVF